MQLKNEVEETIRMEKQQYVIILRPAPNYGNPDTEEIANQHFKYLKDLLEKGILIMAGRFLDVLYGLVIIEVKTREDAVSVMANDPAVKAKIFHAELYQWKVALRSQ